MQKRQTVTVVSSHGSFEVDAITGAVATPFADIPAELACIVRINLAEYRQWCAREGLAPADTVDILLVGLVSLDDQGHERREDPDWSARSDLLVDMAA
jgi:hypothetical protein